MAFLLGFVMLVILVILTSYLLGRARCCPLDPPPLPTFDAPLTTFPGISEETLLTYPEILYSCAKAEHGCGAWLTCPICLVDYKDSNRVRLLPGCGHFFHTECVDLWLRLNPTCPVCRKSSSIVSTAL
ncbi:hypothetical protein MLD38_024260 [Melastoma candidum]|uniref:Uncharacterized protein n=1 Tax=Melastoma candidum TaxID=119954 RepID=A0ACB9NSQ9_9MYRT|nr:hypothetical protein MLD38_024260 [Melastoma candidum]